MIFPFKYAFTSPALLKENLVVDLFLSELIFSSSALIKISPSLLTCSKKSFFVSFTKHHSPSKRLNLSSSKSISSFFSFLQRSFSIWLEFTFGSLIKRIAPSSSKSLQMLMAADSLVSFVFALNANPKIEIFFPLTVPKSFLTI